MARPSLYDDGVRVTLDLHGATVDEALRIIRLVSREAARRGRDSVRVIHGSSTSDHNARPRTIRQALHDALELGELVPYVIDAVRFADATLLSLDATRPHDRRRLTTAHLSAT